MTMCSLLPSPTGSEASDSLLFAEGSRTAAMTVVLGRARYVCTYPRPRPADQHRIPQGISYSPLFAPVIKYTVFEAISRRCLRYVCVSAMRPACMHFISCRDEMSRSRSPQTLCKILDCHLRRSGRTCAEIHLLALRPVRRIAPRGARSPASHVQIAPSSPSGLIITNSSITKCYSARRARAIPE